MSSSPESRVFKAIQNWLAQSVDSGIEVRQSFQDSTPKPPYLSVDLPSMVSEGQVTRITNPDDTEEIRKDYSGIITVREVGGAGGLLRTAFDSIEDEWVSTIMRTQGVSILTLGDIRPMPRQDERHYTLEWIAEIGFAVCSDHTNTISYIQETIVTRSPA